MQPGFNNNHDQGVDVFTNGLVTLTNVNAIGNWEDGIRVFLANKGATLTNCRADGNNTSLFGSAGIEIDIVGPIVINGGHANDNINFGVWVHNETALDAAPKPVTISNFSANGNWSWGVLAESKGIIKLTSVTANNNTAGPAGIALDNHWLTAGVTLSKVTANGNTTDGTMGARLDTTAGNGGVTITTGTFNTNYNENLKIVSNGLITLTGISANLNNTYANFNGIDLNSTGHDVRITNGIVIGNSHSGIFAAIGSSQKLILTNVLCAGNDRAGSAAPDVTTDGILVWN